MAKKTFDWTSKLNKSKKVTSGRFKSLDDFRRIESIKAWSDEVKLQIENSANKKDWDLVGHAVVLVNDDEEIARDLFCLLAKNSGLNFLYLNADEVMDTLNQHKIPNEIGPCMVYIENGLWSKKSDKKNEDAACTDFQEHLSSLISAFNPNHPVVFATSIESMSQLSKSLRKVGVFDRSFELVESSLQEKGQDFLKLLGLNVCSSNLKKDLGKVGKLIDAELSDYRRQAIFALHLKRLAYREKRKLDFIDLVNLAMRGLAEADTYPDNSEETMQIVAAHEAGHALVAIIDSDGENVPDYATAFPEKNYNGVVAESYAFGYSTYGRHSYADYRHKVRIALAGRAAEQFAFGHENVTVRSASSDLEHATRLCRQMFGFYGISPEMEIAESAGSNLCVIIDAPSASEMEKVERVSQQYLQRQYQAVLNMIANNSHLFDAIKNMLLQNRVLAQDELSKLVKTLSPNIKLSHQKRVHHD